MGCKTTVDWYTILNREGDYIIAPSLREHNHIMEHYDLPDNVQHVLDILNTGGYEAYIVGGSIRDLLMHRDTKDWDFTTNAKPDQILQLFPDGFYNNRFGTVGLPVQKTSSTETTQIFEITTFRSEFGYSDNRRPDQVIWGTSLQEDLSRRDFTINAIAYDGHEFFDPFDGRGDIERMLIRSVGNPNERFKEDALRLMRAIRQAAELSFVIEEKTLASITEDAPLIHNISKERIHDELLRILASNYPADGIMLMRNTGLLRELLPELDLCFEVPQASPQRHHKYDVGTHSIEALRHCPSPDPIVRFATLLHDIGKAKTFRRTADGVITFYNHEIISTKLTREIATRLRFSNKDTEILTTLVRWHQFSVDERQTDSAIRRFIRNVGIDLLDDMLALRTGDRIGGGAQETSWRLELYKKRLEEVQQHPFSVTDLKVNGLDVMRVLEIPSGPKVGSTLQQLFTEVEQDIGKNTREYLIKRLEEIKQSP